MRWIVIVCLIGCGGNDSSSPPPDAPPAADLFVERSGTRLQRRGFDVGGTPLLNQIFDTVRGEACTPQGWSDGSLYCMPYEHVGSTRFLDAGCSTPIGIGYDGDGVTYFAHHDDTACGDYPIEALYHAGARIAQREYFVRDGGECRRYAVSEIESLFALGAQVTPAELAAITVSEPVGTHRLRRRFYESADGLRVAAGYHDADLETACFIAERADETGWNCVPQRIGYTVFADATCTIKAVDGGRCAAPGFASESVQANCPYPDYRIFRAGAEIGDVGYETSEGVCSARAYETKIYALGEEVTVPAAVRAGLGEGRIQRVVVRADDDFSTIQLYDTELGERCGISTASDGSRRCMPQGQGVLTMYRDAACTQPIRISRRFQGNENCNERPPVRYATEIVEIDPLTYKIELYAVTGPFAGALYQGDAQSCEPAPPRYRYFEVGALVPPSAMALATEI